jgi:ssDNA-binding Zn-finger/Zn-ribbon topoisomerase 1
MTRLTARCPVCGHVVDRRQGSPTRRSHAVILYPCQHWLSVDRAEDVARDYQQLRRRINEGG